MTSPTTYSLVTGAAPALEWDRYASDAAADLHKLLDTGECDERKYQEVLELHPCLLPWAYGTFGGGHHGLIHGAVVSQPRLPGLNGKIPDFLMLTRDSARVYAVLVEIESPCKRWFTNKGRPASEFTQAMNQLREWKTWFKLPGNEAKFVHEYRVPVDYYARGFATRYLLIYGRRQELEDSGFGMQRDEHTQADERFVSYDSLAPNANFTDAITTEVDQVGYRATVIPPSLRLGPFQATDHVVIRDKDAAAAKHSMMPGARAQFLASRFAYWDNWARTDPKHGGRGFDTE